MRVRTRNTRAERNLLQGMILGKDSQGGGYVTRAIRSCSDIFSLNDLADSVKEKRTLAPKALVQSYSGFQPNATS
jgi:hypothetical protein